jgi:hypothetical protein
MITNNERKIVRSETIDEVLDLLWDLDIKYFDRELNAIRKEHKNLEEEYHHKCEAIDKVRVLVQEMR